MTAPHDGPAPDRHMPPSPLAGSPNCGRTTPAPAPGTPAALSRRSVAYAALWAAPVVAAASAAPAVAASAPPSPMIIRALAPTGPDIPSTSTTTAPGGTKVYTEDSPGSFPVHFRWENAGQSEIPPGQTFTVGLGKNYYRENFRDPAYLVPVWPKVVRNPSFTPASGAESSMFEVVSTARDSIVLRNREVITPGQTATATVTWDIRTPTASRGFYSTAFVASSQIVTDNNPNNRTHPFDSSPYYVEHDPVTHPADISLRPRNPDRPEEAGFFEESDLTRRYDNGVIPHLTIKSRWVNTGPDPLHLGQIFVVRRGPGLVRGGNSPFYKSTPVNTIRDPQFIETPESHNARFRVVSQTESEIRLESRGFIPVGEEIVAVIRWTVDPIPASAPDGNYGNRIIWSTEAVGARVNRARNNPNLSLTSATFRKA